MSKNYNRKPNIQCAVCSKPFYKRPSEIAKSKSGKVYCSKACYGIGCRSAPKECPACGNKFWTKADKSRKTCSRKCANSRRKGTTYRIGRKKDKVKHSTERKRRLVEERGAICETCGYDNVNILQVHHGDRNRQNNDPCNLQLLCPNCHYTLHYGDSRI